MTDAVSNAVAQEIEERVEKMRANTLSAVRAHYSAHGSISPDFAVQHWLEIIAQDKLLAGVRAASKRQAAATIKSVSPTLPSREFS